MPKNRVFGRSGGGTDMKIVWRKLRDNWLDFWEDDELDMDKKHLSQHGKAFRDNRYLHGNGHR